MREDEIIGVDEIIGAAKPAWMKNPRRNCAGMDPRIFFDGTARATAICGGCPVIKPCLQFALDNGERGIWGGTSERERKRYKKRMKK